jgi:Rrf2 family protein
MKLQKATQFGLYAVLELARDPQSQKSAVDIAKKYGISSNHLAKVMRDLGRAGLVASVRGAGGGYRFSGNSRRVTLMDVITIFEELGSDASGGSNSPDRIDIEDALLSVLVEIDEITQATFSSITLDTLLKTIHWRGQK